MAKNQNTVEEKDEPEQELPVTKNNVNAKILHGERPIAGITLGKEKLKPGKDMIFTLTQGQVTELKKHGYGIKVI